MAGCGNDAAEVPVPRGRVRRAISGIGIAESAWLEGEIRIARAPPGSIESNADVRDNNALTLHIGEPGMLDHIPEERAPSLTSMTGRPPAPAVVSTAPEDGKNESAGSPGRNCRKELTARPGPIKCLASGQRPAASGQRPAASGVSCARREAGPPDPAAAPRGRARNPGVAMDCGKDASRVRRRNADSGTRIRLPATMPEWPG